MLNQYKMSPCVILLILFATGTSYAEVSTHFTEPRPFNRHTRNDTWTLKSNPDSETINYYKIRPFRYDPYKPENKKMGFARHQRNEVTSYNSRMYRSYGRGNAEIPYLGATVSVLNAVTYPKVQKGTVRGGTIGGREEIGQLISREKRKCRSCPRNRKVIASKGNTHVLLPEPCPYLKWHSLSGPEPGTLLKEGTYTLIGRVGSRGKLCQYKYEVLVRRCGALSVTSGHVNCTAEDVWGSKCTFICNSNHDLEGPEVLECGDYLQWSNEPPICRRRIGCSYPQTPDNRKVSCQVPEEKELFGDLLPRGTQCQYKTKGKQTILKCLDGYWVRMNVRDVRNKMRKIRKHRKLKRKSE